MCPFCHFRTYQYTYIRFFPTFWFYVCFAYQRFYKSFSCRFSYSLCFVCFVFLFLSFFLFVSCFEIIRLACMFTKICLILCVIFCCCSKSFCLVSYFYFRLGLIGEFRLVSMSCICSFSLNDKKVVE